MKFLRLFFALAFLFGLLGASLAKTQDEPTLNVHKPKHRWGSTQHHHLEERLAEIKQVCQEDISKLCEGKEQRGLVKCLRRNHAELSGLCKDKVVPHFKHFENVANACQTDIQRFCGEEVNNHPHRAFHCLRGHHNELSAECIAAFNKHRLERRSSRHHNKDN